MKFCFTNSIQNLLLLLLINEFRGKEVLNIFNVPFATKGNKFASQSRINDGFNDIIMQTNDKSKAQLISYFLSQDEGDYF